MTSKNKWLLGIGGALAAAAAATSIYFFNKKRKEGKETPPKKAPQLHLENPGEQSEFTSAASESEVG